MLNENMWYDPKGLNLAYGFSTSRQAALRAKKKIPFHRIGRYIRYKKSDIEAWIENHKVA